MASISNQPNHSEVIVLNLDSSNKKQLTHLPNELIHHIEDYLPQADIARLCFVTSSKDKVTGQIHCNSVIESILSKGLSVAAERLMMSALKRGSPEVIDRLFKTEISNKYVFNQGLVEDLIPRLSVSTFPQSIASIYHARGFSDQTAIHALIASAHRNYPCSTEVLLNLINFSGEHVNRVIEIAATHGFTHIFTIIAKTHPDLLYNYSQEYIEMAISNGHADTVHFLLETVVENFNLI